MRPWLFLSAVLVTAATPALAQVTVDLHALQALPSRAPAARAPRSPPPATQGAAVATSGASAGVPAALTRVTPSAPAPAAPPPQQPDLPENVPDTAAITPIAPPEPPAGAPPPPPISDKAATTAAPTATGLRLTFAPEQSDLSPESSASIKQFTAASPPGDTTFNVLAYAPGKSDDPSTARRVSLSRAMVVRGALVADGIPSARIFVRALGEQYGDGPPDRVDIGVTGGSPSSSPAATR